MTSKINKNQVFISYSGDDEFEADLLKFALETSLQNKNVVAWIFQKDQKKSEKEIAQSLKARVKESIATIFLVSPTTGPAQWTELAYADAFNIETFILLHHLSYNELKNKGINAPPLLLSSHCNDAVEWKNIVTDIGKLITLEKPNG